MKKQYLYILLIILPCTLFAIKNNTFDTPPSRLTLVKQSIWPLTKIAIGTCTTGVGFAALWMAPNPNLSSWQDCFFSHVPFITVVLSGTINTYQGIKGLWQLGAKNTLESDIHTD